MIAASSGFQLLLLGSTPVTSSIANVWQASVQLTSSVHCTGYLSEKVIMGALDSIQINLCIFSQICLPICDWMSLKINFIFQFFIKLRAHSSNKDSNELNRLFSLYIHEYHLLRVPVEQLINLPEE